MDLVHLHTDCPKINEQVMHSGRSRNIGPPCRTFDKARRMLLNGDLISKNVLISKTFRILEMQKVQRNVQYWNPVLKKEQTAIVKL